MVHLFEVTTTLDKQIEQCHQPIPSGTGEFHYPDTVRIYGCNLDLDNQYDILAWQTGATIYGISWCIALFLWREEAYQNQRLASSLLCTMGVALII
ncbi:hypothetical protein C2U47_09410 [Aeromonas sp. ASNIH7]|nr:hypothetical protein C2U47_09410 [Aeromonas sp. ASNIH7]